MMKINIYYGGRGLIEDPTIYVMNKLTEVLTELRVEVTRYNLYEEKNGINMLPKTLKEADGVILATTVEWFGIGGLMQQFLDACWLYGDKEKLSNMYMLPVVMASTYGERDAEFTLMKAWEMLGGIPCNGLCAYVEDHVEFETNPEYMLIIEKGAEMLYRNINQKIKVFPNSLSAVKQSVLRSNTIDLTPQESEQLSMYVSDDTYVKKQKEDIEELTQIFKEMLGDAEANKQRDNEYIKNLKENFHPIEGFKAAYVIQIVDMKKTLIIEVNEDKLNCSYKTNKEAEEFIKSSQEIVVLAKTKKEVMDKIVSGRIIFHKAFMSGDVTAKGNFKILRSFDTLFPFEVL